MTTELPITLTCEGATLIGVLFRPDQPPRQGVVIVVGGPQYRIGSHRQFVMLARDLAEAGIAVLSFDHRGMGDSDGAFQGFEHLDADIRSAVDALTAHLPELDDVVLWGLCDGASAICFYAHQDPRISGVVMVNPWVRTEQSFARAYIRTRYKERLRDPAFWRGLVSGRINPVRLLRSILGALASAAGLGAKHDDAEVPFPERMARGLARFKGRVLVIVSGRDLTAEVFEAAAGSPVWRAALDGERVTRRRLDHANHNYSRAEWREQVHAWTVSWLRSWQRGATAGSATATRRRDCAPFPEPSGDRHRTRSA